MITQARSLISIPRAATSVATRKRRRPALIFPITRSRSFCARSPLISSASKPRRLSAAVTRCTSALVLQKMIAESGFSNSRIRARFASFSACGVM